MRHSWLLLAVCLHLGCGAGRQTTTPGPCGVGTAHLKRSLGPEFGKIRQGLESAQPEKPAHACALIYTRLAEELPDEMPDGDGLFVDVDERLALMLLPLRGTPRFRKIPASSMSPGFVRMNAKLMDVTGDAIDDFVVEERAPIKGDPIGYRGLRIFDGRGTSGAEIFSFPLKIKTVEGLELVPRWRVKTQGSLRVIEYTGGGETRQYLFDSRQGKFIEPHRSKTNPDSGAQTPKTSQTSPAHSRTPSKRTPKMPASKTKAPKK